MKPAASAVAGLGLVLVLSGCFASRTKAPGVYGVDLRASPGVPIGGRLSAHPTVAWARSVFGGGTEGATTATVHAGGQLRLSVLPGKLWVGAEGGYARQRRTFEAGGPDDETTNGWTAAALIGFPLAEGQLLSLHYYAAFGMSGFDSSGPYGRIGLDVQPGFLNGR